MDGTLTALPDPRCLAPREQARLVALFEAVYGSAWQNKTCTERYLGCPRWPASVSVLEADGLLVGAQPAYDLPLWISGALRSATVLADVVTHPDYRRRGVFSRLVDHATTLSGERGASVVLTTPNGVSYQGFRKKREWVLLARLECRVRVLRPAELLKRRLHLPSRLSAALAGPVGFLLRGRLREGSRSDGARQIWPGRPALDDLWRACAPVRGVMQRRDADWVEWRFSTARGRDIYSCLTETRGGDLLGYSVIRLRDVAGLSVALVVDCLAADPGATGPRLSEACREWAEGRGAALLVFYSMAGSAWSKAMGRAGFMRLPSIMMGRPYRVCAKLQGTPDERATLADPGMWHMTLADSDLA